MIVTTLPRHWVGILGMPRRMVYCDYSDPAIALEALSVSLSAIGAFVLLVQVCGSSSLAHGMHESTAEVGASRFSVPVHPVRSVPLALNSYAIWGALMIGLTVTNYGYKCIQATKQARHKESGTGCVNRKTPRPVIEKLVVDALVDQLLQPGA